MFRKLEQENAKWDLTVNKARTEYMVVGEEYREDLKVGDYKIRNIALFKLLRISFITNGSAHKISSIKLDK